MRLDNRREIELAEGVHIYLRPAGIYPRLLARLIDFSILAVVYLVVGVMVAMLGSVVGAEAGAGFYQLSAFLLLWFYDPLWEASKWSGTPGKLALGLKVVRRSGAPVGFASGFLRVLLLWIDILPGLGAVGMVSILASKKSQRLGDLVADTLVVYSRNVVIPQAASIPVPALRPGIALQREEQIAFVQFADRAPGLSPERRAEIAAPLAALKSSRQSPNPTTFALGVAHWLSKNEK
jgi:uncharacterized RDD family membrane protein YckC